MAINVGGLLASAGVSVPTNVVDILASIGLQRDFNFEVRLPDVKGISGILIGQYCQSITFGQYNISDISKVRWGAFRRGYAGALEIPPMHLTFIQPIPDLVSSYFTAWRSLIVDSNGFYSPKNSYARTMYVALFDRSGVPVSLYKMTGVFPKQYPAHRLSSKSQQIKEFEIELNVDNYVDMLNDVLG